MERLGRRLRRWRRRGAGLFGWWDAGLGPGRHLSRRRGNWKGVGRVVGEGGEEPERGPGEHEAPPEPEESDNPGSTHADADPSDPPAHPGEREAQPPFPEQEQEHPGITEAMAPTPDHGEQTYRGLGRLEDKVALITGGDSGIGRAVAIAFAREGAHVVFSYLGEAERRDAEETLRWIRDAGREAVAIPADLSNVADCHRLVEETVDRFGRIDLLVNNAAFQGESVDSLEDLSEGRIHHTFATNIEAMFHITRRAVPRMGPGSAIVNSSSIQAFEPSPGILDYAATKAAIYNFTKGLAKSLAARGIRVNAVAPGPVWTPLVTQSFDPEHIARFGENTPLGRPAQPKEMAPVYVFLACDESRYVTGEVLGATGGRRLA